jgi:CubicO group peptidase (beta-lactamase class C family)
MKIINSSTILMFILLIGCQLNTFGQYYYPPSSNNSWERTTPKELGWNESLIDSLQNLLVKRNTKSFVVLHKGKIVLEWYFDDHSREKNWYWASAGKTLTAGLVGIAESKNQLKLTDLSNKYLNKGWTTCSSSDEDKITVWHQLTMTTGLDERESFDCTEASCLKCRTEPGVRWFYHNAPYTLLDGVIQGATQQNLNLYFRNEIGQKIGMDGIFIKTGENNVFYSTTLSMARYGHLLLSDGRWNGAQIIPSDFIQRLSNSSQNINPSYGYLTWLNGKEKFTLPGSAISFNGMLFPNAPHDLYAALGKNDQKIHVVPSMDLVMVRMGDAASDAGVSVPIILDREIWNYLGKIVGLSPSATSDLKFKTQNLIVNTLVTDNILRINPDVSFVRGSIFNKMGQKVKEFSEKQSEIADLKDGLYFVVVRLKNGQLKNEKVIKM